MSFSQARTCPYRLTDGISAGVRHLAIYIVVHSSCCEQQQPGATHRRACTQQWWEVAESAAERCCTALLHALPHLYK